VKFRHQQLELEKAGRKVYKETSIAGYRSNVYDDCYLPAVCRIWIRSDPELFAGSGSGNDPE